MSKNTVFGEESFIDKEMVAMSEHIETALIDDIYKTTLQISFDIDKRKLEKWLMFCAKLENIEETELIDMATKKKIADLKDELDQQKAMWNILKEWVSFTQPNINDEFVNGACCAYNYIKDKMQDLEKGEKYGRKGGGR